MTPREPFEPGAASELVQAVVTADGEDAVLKIQDPHRESEHEAAALELWAGEGAIRLLAHDPEEHALLLERCFPGTPLSERTTEASMDVLVGLLPRLWKRPDGFRSIEDDVPFLRTDIEGARDERLKDAALSYLRELVPSQGERVLVNQDLHGENVLAAQREPWLVIDPKPLAAERELSAASIVRSDELGHRRRDVLYRLDRLCSDLGLDRERAIGWTVLHTVAWSGGDDVVGPHLEAVHWLLEAA
ncbi:MAG TPA: aminoglycoside phosphotransferase family protein [Gaiellaceae bacterium]